ncbi:type IX secretion system membrane protein PorP/SprF [uncultured Polaribacter sp.]|uniref:PorP/SprF family type IX secretion system membrane protein n=1 Tax=uncultured Polaribacter sp. TaxID=174711 RepID=UPI002339729A|nr:type IX secretion system membrane protein PorP/SprF [Polaribacter sp.]MDC1375337.1 type IX secretion system membrane protein PorP/SprF [Polaribacter sp.]
MKKIVTLVFVLISGLSYAQQDAQFSNYMYNTLSFNPAYAGSRGTTSIYLSQRKQWVGLEGAPSTNSLSYHSPLGSSNVGIGLSLLNDAIGPVEENLISLDISYSIQTSYDSQLAFGLRASAHMLNVDFTQLNIFNPSDVLAQSNINNRVSPNIGFGMFWYSDKSYVGFSIPNLLETSHINKGLNSSVSSISKERLHYHFTAGHVFNISQDILFKPAILTKIVSGTPFQLDLSSNFQIYDKFTIGASYRLDAAVSFLGGFQINRNWLLGYAYDFDTNNLSTYNSGSHEVFLRYEVFRSNRVRSPRFF